MDRGRWRKILTISGIVLLAVGSAPIAALLCDGWTHNDQPLSIDFPLRAGQYATPEFKTDRAESYVIQMELMDSTGRGVGLNDEAVLDLDWKVTDLKGAVIASGALNQRMLGANTVNVGEYAPKRGSQQKMTLRLHRDFEEPAGSKVRLEVNSTEDPEGRAFGFWLFMGWAGIVGGAGAAMLLTVLVSRIMRQVPGTPSRTPQMPRAARPETRHQRSERTSPIPSIQNAWPVDPARR